MDTILGIVAQDVRCHRVVGLGAVSEALTKNLVAKRRLIDTDQLTAAGQAVDPARDARLEHASQALGLRVLDRLIESPWIEWLAIKVDADVAANTNQPVIRTDLAEHLDDAELIKDGVGVHANEIVDRVHAMLYENSANVIVQSLVEHGHHVRRAPLEVIQERTGEAQAVTLALVVALANKDIRQTLVVTILDIDRHEKTISGTVTIVKAAELTFTQNVLEEVLLSGLLHAWTTSVTVNDDEDDLGVVINLLLIHERVKGPGQLIAGFIVAGKQQDQPLGIRGGTFFSSKPTRQTAPQDGIRDDANHHKGLKCGV